MLSGDSRDEMLDIMLLKFAAVSHGARDDGGSGGRSTAQINCLA